MKKAYVQPEFESLTLKSAHDFLNASLVQGTDGNEKYEDVADNGTQDYKPSAPAEPGNKWV